MSRLRELTREGAVVVSVVEVWRDGVQVDEREVEDGSVAYDASARVLRSCALDLVGPLPDLPNDPLAPSGGELRVFRGVRDWTGETFFEPLGRYAFDATEVSRASRLSSVTAYDYSQAVSDARWENPYAIAAGTNVATAIVEAVESRLPPSLWLPPVVEATSATTPAIVWGEERDNDPFDDVASLAASAGLSVVFDRTGRLTIRPTPDPDEVAVVEDFTVGDSPALLTTSRTLDGRAYNVVVAVGEPEDDSIPPVRAVAEDDNPSSPSYVGRYRRPYFMASPYITTVQQATDAARGELNRRIGLGEVVGLATVPLPWLDVWDVIRAHDPALNIDARYVVDKLTIPLRPGEATLTTRRRRL